MSQRIAVAAFVLFASLPLAAAAQEMNPNSIDVYVTPYYNSKGPVIEVGRYSSGLASKSTATFVATIHAMSKQWNTLRFYELYAGAIRLYDLGYRKEAVYWFYTAQYRGKQFSALADPAKLGTMGDPGFELNAAQDAFFQLVGPTVNGYAFGDPDALAAVIHRVQRENQTVANLPALYPGVAFENKSQWSTRNARINEGLGQLATMLATQKQQIEEQRRQNGTQARFAAVTSKDLPH